MASPRPVLIVGAGMAGAACARRLASHEVPVRVVGRGHVAGGRMAAPVLACRRVDLGASYVTVSDPGFAARVDDWASRGLIRPWTDRFDVYSPAGYLRRSVGPLRWGTPGGMHTLVAAELDGIDARLGVEVLPLGRTSPPRVDGTEVAAVVLAMPDPQAAAMLGYNARSLRARLRTRYDPAIVLAAEWSERVWSFADGCFVNGDSRIEFVADDGARRGDGAAVLVVHSTPNLAAQHLSAPEGARQPMLSALDEVLGISRAPLWSIVHPWPVAKPASRHRARFAWHDSGIGVAGDSWCPTGSPRIEAAWLSGTALADRILRMPGVGS